MTLQDEKHGDVWMIAPAGRIDSVTSPSLEEALARAIDRGERRVVVDFGGVDYISSAGLRVMLVAAKRLREGGRLVLCRLNEPVRQVFDLAGFLPLFALEPSRDGALRRAGQ
jgi:anti-anti-sigma factor